MSFSVKSKKTGTDVEHPVIKRNQYMGSAPLKERILTNTKKESGCWVWKRSLFKNGYGQMRVNGKACYAHIIAYVQFIGAVPEGLELDHLCRNRSCCNPEHLEPVTRQINNLRGEGLSSVNAHKNALYPWT